MSINRSIAELLRSHSTIPVVAAPGKNLVQNGAMTVNQRGSVAVAADNTGTVDRYLARLIGSGAGRFTVTQDTTVPSGEGFAYSLKVDVTTIDSSISGSEYYGIAHTIEAQNLQQLNFNNANAEALTLTFWARAKKAGLHGGAIYNNDANRSLVFSWTAVADTWQKVTVPVPAETSAGTINNDTGAGLSIFWGLGAGAYLASDTDAWAAGAFLQVTSAVNDLDSTSNDFYLTGVQLEIGSVATSFAHEDIGTTLWKCYRYLWRFQANNASGQKNMLTGYTRNTNSCRFSCPMPTEMRAVPTFVASSGTTSDVYDGVTQTATDTIAIQAFSPGGGQLAIGFGQDGVAGNAINWLADNGETFDFTAEL